MKRYTLGTLIAAILLTAVSVFNISYVLIWNAFNSRLSALNDREAEYAKLNEIRAYLDEYYILDTDSASPAEASFDTFARLASRSSYIRSRFLPVRS